MDKELHQRINEAAVDITVDIINRNPQPIYFVAIKEAAFRGAKFGYKEAIDINIDKACEWLYKQLYTDDGGCLASEFYQQLDNFLAAFREAMNELP